MRRINRKETEEKLKELNMYQSMFGELITHFQFIDYTIGEWIVVRIFFILISKVLNISFSLPDLRRIRVCSGLEYLDACVDTGFDFFDTLPTEVNNFGWSMSVYSAGESGLSSYELPRDLYDFINSSYINTDYLEDSAIYVYDNPALAKFISEYKEEGQEVKDFLLSYGPSLFGYYSTGILDDYYEEVLSKFLLITDKNVYWAELVDETERDTYSSSFNLETFVILKQINKYMLQVQHKGGAYGSTTK